MKKTHQIFMGLILPLALASCNGNGNHNGSDSTSTTTSQMNAGDSAVTTTTTVVHHKYAGTFTPQPTTKYLDLKTNRQITVRIDTVRGAVVNSETNEPVDLLVEPTKHDTIYGQTGTVVNNYIIKDDAGGYRVDTVRINTTEPTTQPAATNTTVNTSSTSENGVSKMKGKEKDNGDKTKAKVK